jgi:hypothetical protein
MITGGFTNLPKTQTEYGNGSHGKYEFWDGADGGVNDGDMIWGPKFVPGLQIAQWNSPIRDKTTGQVIPWYGAVTELSIMINQDTKEFRLTGNTMII